MSELLCPRCHHPQDRHVGGECRVSLNEAPSCLDCQDNLNALWAESALPQPQIVGHQVMADKLYEELLKLGHDVPVYSTYAEPQPITMDSIREAMRKIEDAKPTVVARPENVPALERHPDRGLFKVVESDFVDEGRVYIIAPDALDRYKVQEAPLEFLPLVDPDEAFIRGLVPDAAEWQIRLYLRLLRDDRPVTGDEEA